MYNYVCYVVLFACVWKPLVSSWMYKVLIHWYLECVSLPVEPASISSHSTLKFWIVSRNPLGPNYTGSPKCVCHSGSTLIIWIKNESTETLKIEILQWHRCRIFKFDNLNWKSKLKLLIQYGWYWKIEKKKIEKHINS